MGGLMIIYSFTDSRGVNHDIKQQDLEEAYRILLLADFPLHEAHDKAIDYIVARLQLNAIALGDLLYHSHNFEAEERLCSLVTHRLQERGISLTA
jgi:hypothetical protein